MPQCPSLCLIVFERSPYCFPQQLNYFTFSPATYKGSNSFISATTLVILCLFVIIVLTSMWRLLLLFCEGERSKRLYILVHSPNAWAGPSRIWNLRTQCMSHLLDRDPVTWVISIHHCCLRVCISRKLNQESGIEIESKHSDVECGHPNCWDKCPLKMLSF